MLESHPSTSPGVTVGYALMAGLIALDSGLFVLLLRSPVTLLSFLWGLLLLVSLPLLAVLAYWTSSLGAVRYHVVEEMLLIEWGGLRQVIPLAAIQLLELGREATAVTRFRGLRWPGLMIGRGRLEEQDVFIFATRSQAEQLLLHTETAVYAISPVDLENYRDCLVALRAAQPGETTEWPDSNLGFLQWQLGDDWPTQLLLAAAVVLNLALFAYLTAVYGRLP
ncbi:MAG: PH domain-containing protein, partial [Anaerolineae bacterium]